MTSTNCVKHSFIDRYSLLCRAWRQRECRMQLDETLLLGHESLELKRLEISQHHLTLFVSTTATRVQCPVCSCVSDRVHSHYTRTLADLPWHGLPVTLRLRIRRFFCQQSGCRRTIFAQRLPEIADSYARKTERLEHALSLVGFALGGEAGYRLAVELGMVTSPDTLLRRLRRRVRRAYAGAVQAAPGSALGPRNPEISRSATRVRRSLLSTGRLFRSIDQRADA